MIQMNHHAIMEFQLFLTRARKDHHWFFVVFTLGLYTFLHRLQKCLWLLWECVCLCMYVCVRTLAMKSPASSMALICLSQPEFSRPYRKSVIDGDLISPTGWKGDRETHREMGRDAIRETLLYIVIADLCDNFKTTVSHFILTLHLYIICSGHSHTPSMTFCWLLLITWMFSMPMNCSLMLVQWSSFSQPLPAARLAMAFSWTHNKHTPKKYCM